MIDGKVSSGVDRVAGISTGVELVLEMHGPGAHANPSSWYPWAALK